MNIVVLSDLNWHPHLRSIDENEINRFSIEDLAIERYQRIRRYFEIIQSEKAEVVLLAGDVTGDGFCGHGFQNALIILLKLLEDHKIPTAFISGNHDPDENYLPVVKWIEDYQYVHEISDRIVDLNGLKVLGVNYDTSKSKRRLREAIETFQEPTEIVLAHSQIKRRIRHFEFNSNYVITGHYDRKLLAHRDTVFVALDNDSEECSYALIKKRVGLPDQVSIKIKVDDVTYSYSENQSQLISGNRNSILEVNNNPCFDLLKLENASDGSLSRDGEHFLYLKYLRGVNYASSLDTMVKMKNKIPTDLSDLSLNQLHGLPITANYKISESMIEDYLGNVIK